MRGSGGVHGEELMPNLFSPQTNIYAKVSVFVLAVLPWAVIYAGMTISRSPANTNVGIAANQPVPFSHQHHALELGIDCRYCHVNVEKSSYATVPPTETCMSCHSQIWTNSPLLEPVRKSYETGEPITWQDGSGEVGWTQLNRVPDFVYFNHSIHINRGVNCNQCHGPVQKMMLTYKGNPFQMRWCLQCHQNPENYLYKDPTRPDLTPRQQVFSLYEKLQEGAPLSPREQALANGDDYKPSLAEQKQGEEIVNQLHIQAGQNRDCSICHH